MAGSAGRLPVGWLWLLAHLDVGVVEHPVLCAGAVPAGVLAEVIELLERAAVEHLPEEQEHPVDPTLVGADIRPRDARLALARAAAGERSCIRCRWASTKPRTSRNLDATA
jgi:hypothetical protein